MDYGTFCSSRETFGISINKELLVQVNTRNCSLVNEANSDELIPVALKILTGISWLIIVLIGTIANISVLCVIGFIKSMRTIPNWLLFNLAVADSLMTIAALPLLGVFQTFYYPIWKFTHASCYVLNIFTHIGALASGASLAAISVHRFIVIRFPRKFYITKRHLIITVGLIWLIAIGGSASSMSNAGVIGMVRPVDGHMYLTRLCIQVNPSESKEDFQLAFRFSMYVLYAFFLLFLYTNIGYHLHQSKSPGLKITASQSDARKRQAVRMLSTATAVMILSYLPYMVLVCKLRFAESGYYSPVFAIEIFCNILSGVNHAVNPFIYCALSSQFREGFKKWFAYLRGIDSTVSVAVPQQQCTKKISRNSLLEARIFPDKEKGPGDGVLAQKSSRSITQLSLISIVKAPSESSLNEKSYNLNDDEVLSTKF